MRVQGQTLTSYNNKKNEKVTVKCIALSAWSHNNRALYPLA